MTNEEINILLNWYIDQLESGNKPTEIQTRRVIKALRQVIGAEDTANEKI